MYRGHYSLSMPKPYSSLNMPQKFPEDIECIIKGKSPSEGSLYISNIEAAENLNTLKRFQIRAVLTCAKGYELHHPVNDVPYYKYIVAVDHQSCDISGYFDEAADFIKEALSKTNILVHCIAGVSRSVSMTIAYLIREQGMSYDQAYRFVKSRRKIIHPNDGFIALLKKYEQNIRAKAPKRQSDRSPEMIQRQRNGAVTPTKLDRGYYDRLKEHTSTQLTPQPRSKYEDKHIDRYQSTQLTHSKGSNHDNLYTPQTKKFKYDMYLTSGLDGRLERSSENHKKYLPKTYETLVKSPHVRVNRDNYKTVSETIINIDPPKQEHLTPKNISKAQDKEENSHKIQSEEKLQKESYFDNMNKELSQKIQEIRKKYDGQRQKLYQKYQTSGQRTAVTPIRDDIKVERSPLLRHNYISENRNKSVNDLSTKKDSYLNVHDNFMKSYAYDRNQYQGYSETKGRFSPNDYSHSYASNTKDYFYRQRQSYPQRADEIYTKKFNFGENQQDQNNADLISNRYTDLRKKIDTRLKNYGTYNQINPYQQRGYKDYYSSYSGYRKY